MDACILSMQSVNNMGSLLQAYVLKKLLESMDIRVSFLDIKKIDEDYSLLGDFRLPFNLENEKRGKLGKISKIDKYIINRIENKFITKEQEAIFENFRRTYLEIYKVREKYDLCVIGSDEVFNCLNAGSWGFTSQLFGNVPEAKKVITYAASCGATTYEKLPDKVVAKIIEVFKDVSGFSVRDKNTKNFVSRLTNRKITENLDPVLIYDFDNEIEGIKLSKLPSKYCVIYSYGNRIHDMNERNSIMSFCKRHEMIPVAIGAPQFWCKDYIACSPFECLKIFQNAEHIITDTFHGTIFSVKYAKKFAVLTRESNKNKMIDLVTRLNVTDHVIEDCSMLESNYSIKKNEQSIQRILETEKDKTINYLKNSVH